MLKKKKLNNFIFIKSLYRLYIKDISLIFFLEGEESWKSGVSVVSAADLARCIHVHYVEALFVEIVSTFKKVFVSHVKGLKEEILINHSNNYSAAEI